jgi:4-hydroxybenzoate polyprenyltransferase
MPARFGIPAALTTARVCHVLTIAAFALLGWMMGLGLLYWLGVLVVAALLVYEHSLVSPGDLSRLDLAFFSVNGYIAVILFLAVLGGRLT